MYIDEYDIPTHTKVVRFGDIDPSYLNQYLDCDIYTWFVNCHYERLSEDILKYKDVYKNGYQKIMEKINARNHTLSKYKKIEVLMKYLNQENIDIPTGRGVLRFCDIDNNIRDTTNVGIWIQTNLEYNLDLFIEMYSDYKDIYSEAYNKLNYRINKKDNQFILRERVSVFVKFLNHYFIKLEDKFCDIGPNSYDKAYVRTWYNTQIKDNYDVFMVELKNCCDKYQLDAKDILDRANRNIEKEIKIKKYFIKEKKRIELFMKYLEEHEFPFMNNRFSFKDIDSDIEDNTIVMFWFQRLIREDNNFLNIFKDYQNIYPKAYERVMVRSEEFFNKKNMFAIPFSVKFEAVIKYLEEGVLTTKLSFCDIDKSIDSNSLVLDWLNNEMQFNLNRFIGEMNNYKDIYPNGYMFLANKVNNSNARIKNERLLLIYCLKNIRSELEKNSVVSIKKLEKR